MWRSPLTPVGKNHVWVYCCLGGWGKATGKAWYDDLSLQLDMDATSWIIPTYSRKARRMLRTLPIMAARRRLPNDLFMAQGRISPQGSAVRWRLICWSGPA